MITLPIRDLVRNAAAVFSGIYGSVTRRAQQSGCSRQTLYDHARQVEQRLQTPDPESPTAEVPVPTPAPSLDQPTRRRLAVTAFAMGISTRQIEDLLRVLLGEDGPDHSTIARWVAEAAEKA
jgi:transposase-like protein